MLLHQQGPHVTLSGCPRANILSSVFHWLSYLQCTGHTGSEQNLCLPGCPKVCNKIAGHSFINCIALSSFLHTELLCFSCEPWCTFGRGLAPLAPSAPPGSPSIPWWCPCHCWHVGRPPVCWNMQRPNPHVLQPPLCQEYWFRCYVRSSWVFFCPIHLLFSPNGIEPLLNWFVALFFRNINKKIVLAFSSFVNMCLWFRQNTSMLWSWVSFLLTPCLAHWPNFFSPTQLNFSGGWLPAQTLFCPW